VTMPNFFVVGAQKAGTTSLYHYLDQHPQVYMSPVKEPHFFEGMYQEYRWPGLRKSPVTDLRDYLALFDGVSDEKAIGEVSTSYLYSQKAPGLIRRSIPDAKLIAVLRNPADRAYSNYLHLLQLGFEPLANFADALQAEEGRVRDKWGPMWYYRRKGFYHAQIERYFDTFDRDRVMVYLYDDLRAHSLDVLRDIFRFLEVDETFVPDTSIEHNTSGLPRSKTLYLRVKKLTARYPGLLERFLPAGPYRYAKSRFFVKPPPFPTEVRRELIDSYREDILKLQELIGRDLSPWLRDKRESS
jgi:Sulfotransferase family